MLKLKRIDNMDILTPDVQRLVDFYHGVLGLPFFLPYQPEEHWAALDTGNLTLYIFRTTNRAPNPRRTAVNLEDPPGFDSFAFEVADLDQAGRIAAPKTPGQPKTAYEGRDFTRGHSRGRSEARDKRRHGQTASPDNRAAQVWKTSRRLFADSGLLPHRARFPAPNLLDRRRAFARRPDPSPGSQPKRSQPTQEALSA